MKPEDFGKKSALRNPTIASLLHHANYIEKMGTGISKIRRMLKAAGLRQPKFEFNTFFTVTFKRPTSQIQAAGTEGVWEKFGIKGKRLKRVLGIIETLNEEALFSVAAFAEKSAVSARVIEKDIDFLKTHGLIKFSGARKTGKYVLTEKGIGIIKNR